MDFSKYRQNGELSDITVIVDGEEFKLHKFPLFTRSGYFKTKAQGGDNSVISLDDFPGGAIVFNKVADYCYNVKIDITRDNVCQLRCAAEYLEMTDPGNLADITDRHLQEIITCAKLGRSSETAVDVLLESCSLGEMAENAKITDKCVNGVVDSWLIHSSRLSRRSHASSRGPDDMNKLVKLPVEQFKVVFATARDKNVRASVLASLIQTYTTAVADIQEEDSDEEEEPQESTQPAESDTQTKESTPETKIDVSEMPEEGEDSEKKDEDKDDQSKDQETTEETEDDSAPQPQSTEPKTESKQEEKQQELKKKKRDKPQVIPVETDLQKVLDALLLELPDSAAFAEAIDPEWVVRMVVVAEELDCEHKEVLRKLIRRMIYRLSAKELSDIPAPLLCEILRESSNDNKHVPEMVCHVIDSYLVELANKDELTVDTFKNMVQAVPAEYRSTHDGLFQILELLLNSDKSKVTEEQRQILLEVVDYNRLNEKTLQRAYEENLVPASYVTKAALSLCSKLRTDLDTAKATVRAQQAELDKYGLGKGSRSAVYSKHSYLSSLLPLSTSESEDEFTWDCFKGLSSCSSSSDTLDYGLYSSNYSSSYEPLSKDSPLAQVRRSDTEGAYSSRGYGNLGYSMDDGLEDDLLGDSTYGSSYQFRSPGSLGTYDRYGSYTPRSTSYYSGGGATRWSK